MMRILAALAVASAVSAVQLKQETNAVKIDSIGNQLAQTQDSLETIFSDQIKGLTSRLGAVEQWIEDFERYGVDEE